MNYIRLLVFVIILMEISEVDGANERGKSTIQRAAWKFGPCESASKASNTPVSGQCCGLVRTQKHDTEHRVPMCRCSL